MALTSEIYTPLLIVSQDRLLREALGQAISRKTAIQVLGSASTLEEMMATMRVSPKFSILIDSNQFLESDKELLPGLISMNVKILLLGKLRGKSLPKAILLSRSGGLEQLLSQLQPISKNVGEVRETNVQYGAEEVTREGSWHSRRFLTPREERVLELIACGYSNRQIAAEIRVKEQSIKNVVSALLRKFGCQRRVQLLIALKQNPESYLGVRPLRAGTPKFEERWDKN